MNHGPLLSLTGKYSIYRDTWVRQYHGKPTKWRPLFVAPREPLRDPQGGAGAGRGTRLRNPGIVEPSTSPWRAQFVVVNKDNNNHKKRLCIDYRQTINKFTLLDAYPLLRIQTVANSATQYNCFSSLDVKNAYHQVPILPEERCLLHSKPMASVTSSNAYPMGWRMPFPVFSEW